MDCYIYRKDLFQKTSERTMYVLKSSKIPQSDVNELYTSEMCKD